MIPETLIAPIDYEAFYASGENDDVQRFRALSTMIHRLSSVGWLSNGVLSVHIFDWDWRSESNRFNHRHVPMMFLTLDIFDWYRDYGAFLQLDPQRGQQFSFARFFLELAPRRDIIEVRFDLDGDSLFSVERESSSKMNGDAEADAGRVFVPEKVKMRLNLLLARRLCDPMAEFLNAFRRECPPSKKPYTHTVISLADAIGELEEPVSRLTTTSELVRTSVEAYMSLPDQPLIKMGVGKDLLLHGPEPLECERPKENIERGLRFLLANLAMHALVLPESMYDSAFALVPGIARVSGGTPMASGGFLLHYNTPTPAVDLEDWFYLATTWAREKATFDLVERNRRQEMVQHFHNVSNDFGHVIAGVRKLKPTYEAQALVGRLERMQTRMRAGVDVARGEPKYSRYTVNCPEEVLPSKLGEILSNIAGDKGILGNIFGEALEYDEALSRLHKMVDQQELPEAIRRERFYFSLDFVRSVLNELVLNGLLYTPWNVSTRQSVKVSIEVDYNGLYVEVTNAFSVKFLPRLEKIANSLSLNLDPDIIGYGIKHLRNSCTAMKLPQPTMRLIRKELKIVTKCYLARQWKGQSTCVPYGKQAYPSSGDEQ